MRKFFEEFLELEQKLLEFQKTHPDVNNILIEEDEMCEKLSTMWYSLTNEEITILNKAPQERLKGKL